MRISLRRLSETDTSLVVRWRNQEEVRRNLYTKEELTEEQHLNYYKTRILTGLCEQFIILAEEEPVGTVFLKNIDRKKNVAEFGIFLGEQRGKGIGAKATKLMLEHAFHTMELERVVLSVLPDNLAAIRAYERVGFLRILDAEVIEEHPEAIWMQFERKDWNSIG